MSSRQNEKKESDSSKSGSDNEAYDEDILASQLRVFLNTLFDTEDGYYETLAHTASIDVEKRTFTLWNGQSYYIGLVPTRSQSTDRCIPL